MLADDRLHTDYGSLLDMNLSRREFCQAGAAAGMATPATAAAGQRPNILFIQADDLRFDDLSCIGNPVIRTPNLDKLAEEGTRFRNAFVTTAICCCSRACVLTGQHMRRNGIEDFERPLLASQFAETYPALLRKAGYRTAFLGKYAIGTPKPELRELSLPSHQFDHWLGFPQSIDFRQVVDGKVRHLTPLMTESAIGFLRSTPASQPFCMSLNFKEPHGPWNYFDPDRPNRYKDVPVPAPETHTRADFDSQPEFLRKSLNGYASGQWPADAEQKRLETTRTCYHLVAGVDEAVGKVMAALRELGRDGNTVVLFTSDNGSFQGAHGFYGKWIMYEESIRVPLIIRDPRLPANLRGKLRDEMALNIDLAPTMLALAGVTAPDRMQGASLKPLVEGRTVNWREDWFYEHTYDTFPNRLPIPWTEGVRTTRWKYTRYPGITPVYEQLFDLEADPIERYDLAKKPEHQTRLAALRARCVELGRGAA
jgi:arylsulfatase A-like enzyme